MDISVLLSTLAYNNAKRNCKIFYNDKNFEKIHGRLEKYYNDNSNGKARNRRNVQRTLRWNLYKNGTSDIDEQFTKGSGKCDRIVEIATRGVFEQTKEGRRVLRYRKFIYNIS